MKLFFNYISEKEKIAQHKALDASLEQALEVFENLPEDDGSFLGLITHSGLILLFRKFNQFMWSLEIHSKDAAGYHQAICTPFQCQRILNDLFDDKNPFELVEFEWVSGK